ncbi:O-antigen ligase family protein [Sphingomonas sp. R647]|uniref:O-antigen ligase family protein n=1 Tax=Sphingomonas sp. R647 TaxID=2875233 RepID=UPI001CD3CB4A|nr:O-antigen ligase family protein [Sphingomonas sp. R647]MCA1196337.1 O-antigen ligase family protein [Sphingomonas sp. R647]
MSHFQGRWTDQLGLGELDLNPPKDRRGILVVAAVGLIALVLLGPVMTNAALTLTGEGNLLRQVLYLTVAGLAVYAVWPQADRYSLIAISTPVALALGWSWATTIWALNFDASIRRVFLTTLVAWTVFCIVRHLGYRLTCDVLRWSLFVGIVIGFIVVFIDPETGVHLYQEAKGSTAIQGNWRGIFDHKNFAGAAAAICILMFLFDSRHIKPLVRVGVIVLASYFLYRTQSKTSAGMIVLASIAGFIFATVSVRLRAYLIPFIVVFGAFVWTWVSAYSDAISEGFLNPTSFTGRGHIWSVLASYAMEHPWTGAGFGSFWNVGSESPVFSYATGWVTKVTVGHSGYFDQLAAVGFPGLILMVYALIVWPLIRLLASSSISPQQGALISTMIIFSMGHNITESGLFERDVIVSVFLYFGAAFAQVTTQMNWTEQLGALGTDPKAAGDDVMRTMRKRRRRKAP